MGFSVDGERLGLGTNLFSGKKTLAEEMGYESFDAELSKFSDFYAAHFW
jgi:phosphoglycerol transferase